MSVRDDARSATDPRTLRYRTFCEQLERAESRAIGADEALPALHKALLVRHKATDLDYVTLHVVAKDLERLLRRDRPERGAKRLIR